MTGPAVDTSIETVRGAHDPDLYVGKRVLILPGPHTSNLAWGSTGEITAHRYDGYIVVDCHSGSWAGTTDLVHRDQLIGVNLAAMVIADMEVAA